MGNIKRRYKWKEDIWERETWKGEIQRGDIRKRKSDTKYTKKG